jgi:catechol 2,3-dioxygenase-like lactoylglutathione lyase family enzyme
MSRKNFLKEEQMPKIRHVAIASSNREKLAEFYKHAFGMKQVQGEGGAIYLSDGSINLALNPVYAGREAGLYHLGFEVEDLETLKKKLKDAGASSEVQRRPRNREAEYRVLDPDGNPIDLSTRGWPT